MNASLREILAEVFLMTGQNGRIFFIFVKPQKYQQDFWHFEYKMMPVYNDAIHFERTSAVFLLSLVPERVIP
jgi:hypothetical protein